MRSFSLSWHHMVNSELNLAIIELKKAMPSKKCCTEGLLQIGVIYVSSKDTLVISIDIA
jgi:hypothetical protein